MMSDKDECKASVAFGGHVYCCENESCNGADHEATHSGEYEDDGGALVEIPVVIKWRFPL